MTNDSTIDTSALFAGPGEMRTLCRAFDWSGTPLGPVDTWSQSLRTTVGTMLASRHPMFLWWGPDLVQIYNDAYRPSFGNDGRHLRALGARGRQFWTDIWDAIGPQIEQVMNGGEATWHENQYLPIERNGGLEDVWWTYSYSPVRDDDGQVGGTLVVCQETTDAVRAFAEREHLLAVAEARAAELNAVIQSMPDAVYIGTRDGITLVNRPALEQLGYASGNDVRRPVSDLAAEIVTRDEATGEIISGDRQAFVRALGGERVVQNVIVRHRVTGEDRIIRCAAGPVVVDGRTIAAVAVNTDVTESRRTQAALASHSEELAAAAIARETELRTLADAIPTLAWTARSDGYVDWFNARWYEYTGSTPAETVGSGWQSAHDPAVLPRVIAAWRTSVETGTRFEMEFPLRGADGRFRWFLGRVEPLRDAAGTVVRWFGTDTDVDALREARAEAEAARADAEAADRAKGEFLAVMSHELRTPLNAIGGYAELMEMGIRGPVTPQQKEDLRRINASQRHLLGLINEVLNYAKLETGTVHYELSDVPMREALVAAEALVAPQARAKGLQLQIADSSPALVARADSEKLRQILVNLLSNAIKFTDASQGRAGRVDLSCEAVDGARVMVRVGDTGIGIPADKLGAIFDPFVQVRADLTRPHEGTGLGLAISRDLARGMGGDLTVESEVGTGSTFILTLPAA